MQEAPVRFFDEGERLHPVAAGVLVLAFLGLLAVLGYTATAPGRETAVFRRAVESRLFAVYGARLPGGPGQLPSRTGVLSPPLQVVLPGGTRSCTVEVGGDGPDVSVLRCGGTEAPRVR